MSNLEPPEPPNRNEAMVERGRQIFEEAKCNACHHPQDISKDGVIPLDQSDSPKDRLPGENSEYPEGTIATSPLHLSLQSGRPDIERDRQDLVSFILRKDLKVRQTSGYRVNDLRGLWATAPYLHNGSVPTLKDLLSPEEQRPDVWNRHGFEIDTTEPGNSNQGHEFGVELDPSKKEALITYLKSL